MIKKLILMSLVSLSSLKGVAKSVMVEVPCYAKNSAGECSSWAGIVQGCKGPCKINYTVGSQSASCTASAEKSCNAVLPFTALLPFSMSINPVGTTHVKIPCIRTNAEGECVRWGSINQGCKALLGGTCKTNLSFKDKQAKCNAESEGICNSNITIQLP
jgi:hypothetical protein